MLPLFSPPFLFALGSSETEVGDGLKAPASLEWKSLSDIIWFVSVSQYIIDISFYIYFFKWIIHVAGLASLIKSDIQPRAPFTLGLWNIAAATSLFYHLFTIDTLCKNMTIEIIYPPSSCALLSMLSLFFLVISCFCIIWHMTHQLVANESSSVPFGVVWLHNSGTTAI